MVPWSVKSHCYFKEKDRLTRTSISSFWNGQASDLIVECGGCELPEKVLGHSSLLAATSSFMSIILRESYAVNAEMNGMHYVIFLPHVSGEEMKRIFNFLQSGEQLFCNVDQVNKFKSLLGSLGINVDTSYASVPCDVESDYVDVIVENENHEHLANDRNKDDFSLLMSDQDVNDNTMRRKEDARVTEENPFYTSPDESNVIEKLDMIDSQINNSTFSQSLNISLSSTDISLVSNEKVDVEDVPIKLESNVKKEDIALNKEEKNVKAEFNVKKEEIYIEKTSPSISKDSKFSTWFDSAAGIQRSYFDEYFEVLGNKSKGVSW